MLEFEDKLTFVSKEFIKGFCPQPSFFRGRPAESHREHQHLLLKLELLVVF